MPDHFTNIPLVTAKTLNAFKTLHLAIEDKQNTDSLLTLSSG